MARPAPILASEKTAAELLDMKPAEFRALVDAGFLPRGREIAPGIVRWEAAELGAIGRGERIEDAVQW
jgi:hypothetical protein